MLGIRIVSLEIHGPRGVRILDLDHSFVVVHGPTNTGKTSLADAISYCLGQKVKWKKAFGAFVTKCVLRIRIGASEYTLHRTLGRGNTHIELYDSGNELTGYLPVKAGDVSIWPRFSDWILTELKLKHVIDPDEIRALGAESTRLTFDDLWPYLYRTQSELDRQIILHSGIRDIARKSIFELLFGLSSSEERMLSAQISESSRAAREMNRKLAAVRSFFNETRTSPERAAHEHESTLRELKEITDSLHALRAQVTGWDREHADLQERCEEKRRTWSKADEALRAAYRKQTHPVLPLAHTQGGVPTSCPACEQMIPPGRADLGSCDLCLQEQPGRAAKSGPISITPREVDAVSEEEKFALASDALNQALAAVRKHQTRDPVDSRARITELMSQRAALRERLDQLSTRVEQSRTLADLVKGARTADAEVKLLQDDLKTLQEQNTDRETILDELEQYFYREIEQIKLPWFDGSATLHRKSYLPQIDAQEFDQLGGGVKAAVNVAYSLALLAFSARWSTASGDRPLLPRFLMVDAIRKNIGANREDEELSDRLYRRASNAGTNLMDIGQGQVIVLDNDGPSAGVRKTGALKEIELSYEKPLILGVSHADTGEDPSA